MQNTKQIPETSKCATKIYECKKLSNAKILKVLESLRKDEEFDIELKTDDGRVIFAHKVVLSSASPYFHAMFTNFSEKNQDFVVIRNIDYLALQLLVDFIYFGKIMVTEKNVQVLLPAANFLQLIEVKDTCCDFLEEQLRITNCIGTYVLADLHSCNKLLTISESYIQQHFSDVVDADQFLSLSPEHVANLISSDELIVLSENIVFECVIRWVKHDLVSRKSILPHLLEYVRLPLTSLNYIMKNAVEEPLLKNCPNCKNYVNEALYFHSLKPDDPIPQNIRTKPRLGDKVIFVVGALGILEGHVITEWYDPKINRWQSFTTIMTPHFLGSLAVVKDNFVFAVGRIGYSLDLPCQSVNVLDVSSESPHWKPTTNMLVKRRNLGVGVINDYIYAVGGFDGNSSVNSAEAFDCRTQTWRMISSMCTRRDSVVLGVLNNLLYAVGGQIIQYKDQYNSSIQYLKSVECYYPSIDTWKPVAEMCVPRIAAGVGVLDGILYVVGGYDGTNTHRSAEAYQPSTGVWTTIPDMHFCRYYPGVTVLNGLLYVVGGCDKNTPSLDSAEFYNPNTNTWTMVTALLNVSRTFFGAVAIDRSRYFKTKHS
ncbi:ring canal kelch homolog isoform X2 [Metopolophium dirhodum]|uniref:ring canal kelch homolog isoform X2 n=1 Tax=Metopolophium dirhodum TaxID=44670 RepID=UPI00298F4ABF|nr:ring canal kelch homolog isoform X2 [Metopolophium dirhodum]